MQSKINLMVSLAVFFVCSNLWANYPEDVYFFELEPAAWDYFVALNGDKISILRKLDIKDNNYSLNLTLTVQSRGENYRYELATALDDKGNMLLKSLSDEKNTMFFQNVTLFPSGDNMEEEAKIDISPDIIIYKPLLLSSRLRTEDLITYKLSIGGKDSLINLKYRGSIRSIEVGNVFFKRTTQRIFNNTK